MTPVYCCAAASLLALAGLAALIMNARTVASVLLVTAAVSSLTAVVVGARHYRAHTAAAATYLEER